MARTAEQLQIAFDRAQVTADNPNAVSAVLDYMIENVLDLDDDGSGIIEDLGLVVRARRPCWNAIVAALDREDEESRRVFLQRHQFLGTRQPTSFEKMW